MNKLVEGSDGGKRKVKVYKHPGSSYILCHSEENNDEFIYKLQDEIIQDGIFRERLRWGCTAIGSQYMSRSGREEYRIYSLYRDNKSLNIEYQDDIVNVGIFLAHYRFNPETLEWTNILDE